LSKENLNSWDFYRSETVRNQNFSQVYIAIATLVMVAWLPAALACEVDKAIKAPAGGAKIQAKVQAKIQEGFNQLSVLEQLGEMKIVVADFNQTALNHELSKEQIKLILVKSLSGGSYKICDEASDCCTRGSGKACDMTELPILYFKLKISSISDSSKISSFTLNLSLVEKVKVARNGAEAMVAVWSQSESGQIEKGSIDEINQKTALLAANFRQDLDQVNSHKSVGK